MGGGFGGCTINLVQKRACASLIAGVRKKYFAAFKKEADFYQVELSDGVHKNENRTRLGER